MRLTHTSNARPSPEVNRIKQEGPRTREAKNWPHRFRPTLRPTRRRSKKLHKPRHAGRECVGFVSQGPSTKWHAYADHGEPAEHLLRMRTVWARLDGCSH